MSDTPGDELLYPNRGGERETRSDSGRISRRRLLAGSAAAGMVATAGCAGSSDGDAGVDDGGSGPATVFVFNTGDRTVSVIDAAADELVTTAFLGVTSSFPSNQYTVDRLTTEESVMWLNVDDGVRAVTAASLSDAAAVETGSGANWQEVTPDGSHLIVSAREPAHRQYRIDADPGSETFGDVTAEIDRTSEGGRGERRGPGPCDVTIHPDGRYAYVPDIFGDTLTVIDVESFEIANQISLDPTADADADAVQPWMNTAARDGETLLVENSGGETGTESVWDIGDPANPVEVARLTTEDGLGEQPLTSEIGPDSAVGYVFTPDTNDVTVVDLAAAEVTDRIDLGGSAFVGTWGPDRTKLYVPVQTADEVKVIDHAAGEVVETISVGSDPYGATAGRVRPRTDAAADALGTAATLGIDVAVEGAGTTYCIGNCACGHRL